MFEFFGSKVGVFRFANALLWQNARTKWSVIRFLPSALSPCVFVSQFMLAEI